MTDLSCKFFQTAMETNTLGWYRPCCIFKGSIKEPNGTIISTKTHTIAEAFNSEGFNKARQDLANGVKIDGCRFCWMEEEAGIPSKRMKGSESQCYGVYKDGKITLLDLKLGSTCNLKCRTCSPTSSSLWLTEWKQIWSDGRKAEEIGRPEFFEDQLPFWKDIDQVLEDCVRINFTGGEPFLVEKHIEFLRHAVKLGRSRDIMIHYNTNANVVPSQELQELWQEFKEIKIDFSIDGVGSRYEYIRHPGNWETVVENIRNFIDHNPGNRKFGISYTVSIYNWPYVVEDLTTFAEIWPEIVPGIFINLMHGPQPLNITSLPESYKQKIADKVSQFQRIGTTYPHWVHSQLTEAVQFMFSSEGLADRVRVGEQIIRIAESDQIREENFKETFPESYAELAETWRQCRDSYAEEQELFRGQHDTRWKIVNTKLV